MAKFHPPESFEFNHPERWPEWKQRFSRYRTAVKLNKEEDEVQVSTLIYALGKEAEQIFSTFVFEEGEEEAYYDSVLGKFDNYFVPQVNVIHERARFHLRVQKPGESAEEYIRSLHELAQTCAFANVKDENIRDRLVVGIIDKELSEKMQLMPKLTLSTAVELVRQSEQVKEHISEQTASNSAHVNEVARQRQQQQQKGKWKPKSGHGQANKQQKESTGEWKCKRCGRSHGRNDCPAKNATCRRCNKNGHFAIVCRTREVNDICAPQDGAVATHFLGETRDVQENSAWTITLPILDTAVDFKIDTGADISVISEKTLLSLKCKPKLTKVTAKLESPGGKLQCKGQFTVTTTVKNKPFKIKLFVVSGSSVNNLLGRGASVAMGLVKRLDELSSAVPTDIGLLKIKPIRICLKDNAVPYSVTTARRISVPMLSRVKLELERMMAAGVIEEIKEPTEWCAPMVAVPKKNGQIRICVDLKQLNKAVKREKYMLPTIDEILPRLAEAKVFSLLDAASGFWQLPLHEDSAKLTTFLTPFGRYYFRRLPFGITSAPEIFQREMAELLKDQEGVAVFMDDILVYGNTAEQHEQRLQSALRTIENAGLKLNNEKCLLRQSQLCYLGHVIDSNGIRPDNAKIDAITQLQPPEDVSDLRRMLGMVHYLGRYVPHLSEVTRPLNELLRKDTAWTWGPAQDEAFHKVKVLITESPVLAFYDVTKKTIVSADASSYGLGGVILQEHQGVLKPIAYCSRVLTDAEKRYAQIEKECLASVWACEKFSRFLYGLESFTLQTDHKPLVPLINAKDLDAVPLRCQRLLMRMMRYNPVAVYVPGKELIVADALSRSPQPVITAEVSELIEEVEAYEEAVSSAWPISPTRLDIVRAETKKDADMEKVRHYIRAGWPKYAANVPHAVKPYFSERHHLSISKGLVLYGDRIVIPQSMRTDILQKIHSGHQGIVKCRERAQMSVWWPAIGQDIQQIVSSCNDCRESRPTQRKEPLLTTPLPARPWERVGADICELNKQYYLVAIDYFSRYIEIAHLPNLSGETTRARLKCIFARWGCPSVLITDNGPQFSGRAFQQFAKDYDFQHITTSPHYPQANGEAERAVQTAKKILKQSDPFAALLSYRSTPLQATGASPAQLIMGRQIRTPIPTLESNLQPAWPDLHKVKQADAKAKASYRRNFNKRHNVKDLPELSPGTTVALKLDSEQGWRKCGKVLKMCETPRSYLIQTETGVLRRNRHHLMPKVDQDDGPGAPEQDAPAVPEQPTPVLDAQADTQLHQSPDPQPPAAEAAPTPEKTHRGRAVKPPERYKDFVQY